MHIHSVYQVGKVSISIGQQNYYQMVCIFESIHIWYISEEKQKF